MLAPEDSPAPDLQAHLAALPATLRVVRVTAELEATLRPAPSAVILLINEVGLLRTLPPAVKALTRSPVLAVISADLLGPVEALSTIDDFAVEGVDGRELRARVRRLLSHHPDGGDIMRCGDLAINTATCEVSVGGRLIELTFKEYTLLTYLAANPGRVHSREVLLNRVWGYDYYGGDRTVDVHVRRLRSKIEDANHAFIDTVRNIGYRFRADG